MKCIKFGSKHIILIATVNKKMDIEREMSYFNCGLNYGFGRVRKLGGKSIKYDVVELDSTTYNFNNNNNNF